MEAWWALVQAFKNYTRAITPAATANSSLQATIQSLICRKWPVQQHFLHRSMSNYIHTKTYEWIRLIASVLSSDSRTNHFKDKSSGGFQYNDSFLICIRSIQSVGHNTRKHLFPSNTGINIQLSGNLIGVADSASYAIKFSNINPFWIIDTR